MQELSVIILAKNEAANIAAAVTSAALVSNDIIVVDSGSTDETIAIAQQHGARILPVIWKGYGHARNHGASFARNRYVLCLDADEVITPELAHAVKKCQSSPGVVYGFRRRNFLGGKEIRHGEWGHDVVYRIYDKTRARWDLAEVHETIETGGGERQLIDGAILHYTTISLTQYREKLDRYARLSATKFLHSGKKAGFVKLHLSPVFSFVRNYIFRMGFLDGSDGLAIAKLHAGYTRAKYQYLLKLQRAREK